MSAELGGWGVAILLVAAAVYPFVTVGGGEIAEATTLVAVAGLAATAAHLTVGLTARPILALSLPLLAGWWAATLLPQSPTLALLAAAPAGLLIGAGVGLVAGGPIARCAAVTLLLAMVGDGLSVGFASDQMDEVAPTALATPVAACLVVLALGAGWWAQGSLGAALLHRAALPDQGAAAGLDGPLLWAMAGGLGGVPAAVAGVLLAQSGAAPPGVQFAVVLAVAALAGGTGLLAGTLALTAGLWLVPELLARASLVNLDLDLAALALTAAALLLALTMGGLRDRRPHG